LVAKPQIPRKDARHRTFVPPTKTTKQIGEVTMFSTFRNTPVSLGTAALALAAGFAAPAQAGYVVTLAQQGHNVVATGSGPIDLTGLTNVGSIGIFAFILPSFTVGAHPPNGEILTGPSSPATVNVFLGPTLTAPGPLGTGIHDTLASSGSGDLVGTFVSNSNGAPAIFVPAGYVSDSPLSDTSTYDNQTFASVGVTPGTYKWTWGSGANQNFTLIIPTSAVPEPSSLLLLAGGLAGLGVAPRRRKVET
jgi:hypothetical protein